ncbi:MAG: CV_2116 domain-containing protein [Candidatus Sedimenticola endophacoides]
MVSNRFEQTKQVDSDNPRRGYGFMARIYYNGYRIEPDPYQISESGKWAARTVIWHVRTGRREATDAVISSNNTFDTKEEAERSAILFGRDVIDGKYGDLLLDDTGLNAES